MSNVINKPYLLSWLGDQLAISSNAILTGLDEGLEREDVAEWIVERQVYSMIIDLIKDGRFDVKENGEGKKIGKFVQHQYADPKQEDNVGEQPEVCDTCTHFDEEICYKPGSDCKLVD